MLIKCKWPVKKLDYILKSVYNDKCTIVELFDNQEVTFFMMKTQVMLGLIFFDLIRTSVCADTTPIERDEEERASLRSSRVSVDGASLSSSLPIDESALAAIQTLKKDILSSSITEEDDVILPNLLWQIHCQKPEIGLGAVSLATRFFHPSMNFEERITVINTLLHAAPQKMTPRLRALIKWESLIFRSTRHWTRLLLTGLALPPQDIEERAQALGIYVNPLFPEEHSDYSDLVLTVLGQPAEEIKKRAACLRNVLREKKKKHFLESEDVKFAIRRFL